LRQLFELEFIHPNMGRKTARLRVTVTGSVEYHTFTDKEPATSPELSVIRTPDPLEVSVPLSVNLNNRWLGACAGHTSRQNACQARRKDANYGHSARNGAAIQHGGIDQVRFVRKCKEPDKRFCSIVDASDSVKRGAIT